MSEERIQAQEAARKRGVVVKGRKTANINRLRTILDDSVWCIIDDSVCEAAGPKYDVQDHPQELYLFEGSEEG